MLLLSQAYPDASDEEDLVEIEDIEPYAAPGSILNRPTHPTTPGQTHTGDVSRIKSVNPYDNVTDSPDEPDEERRYLNIEEMREHERMSSCEFSSCHSVRNILPVRWLEIVSSTYILMGSYNHPLSLDASIMVSKDCPIIGEHVVTIATV